MKIGSLEKQFSKKNVFNESGPSRKRLETTTSGRLREVILEEEKQLGGELAEVAEVEEVNLKLVKKEKIIGRDDGTKENSEVNVVTAASIKPADALSSPSALRTVSPLSRQFSTPVPLLDAQAEEESSPITVTSPLLHKHTSRSIATPKEPSSLRERIEVAIGPLKQFIAAVIAFANEVFFPSLIVFQDLIYASFTSLALPSLNDHTSTARRSASVESNGEESVAPTKKKVEVAYKINCISNIDSITSTFEVDIKIFLYWKDPKLIGKKKGTVVDISSDGLFNPDIRITNEHAIVEDSNEVKMLDSSTGSVKQSIEAKGTCFLTTMELDMFPFDCQNLEVVLKPYKLAIQDVTLVPFSTDPCSMDNKVAEEWTVLGFTTTSNTTDPATSSTNKVYSTLSPTVLVVRKPGWFIRNVFIVSLLLLFVSWSAFWFEPEELGPRLGTCSAMLLANISTKFVVGDSIPKVTFRTLCDWYIDFCFFLQVVEVFCIVVSFVVAESPHYAALTNEAAFAFQLYTFIVFHFWLGWRLREHMLDVAAWTDSLLMLGNGKAGRPGRLSGSGFLKIIPVSSNPTKLA